MTYDELKINVQSIIENSFTDEQLAMFTKQAEQKLYLAVDLPALRKNQTGVATQGTPYLTLPDNLLYVYSLAVITPQGYEYLLPKDESFIREAYPTPAASGVPKHYGFFSQTSFILGPTPDDNYTVEIHYAYYPESIVDAGETWLGEQFDAALLNGTLVEAARFIKADDLTVKTYDKMYVQSLALLKSLGDGRMKQDVYRNGFRPV
jgi:hypothetical protein